MFMRVPWRRGLVYTASPPHARPRAVPRTWAWIDTCQMLNKHSMSFIPHNLGCTDYNFLFHMPGSKKSCDLMEVTTSKRQNWDLNSDPWPAMQNPGPSPYTTLYLNVRLWTQSPLNREPLVWSGFCNPSGSLEAHSTPPGLGFLLRYTVGDTLHANNNQLLMAVSRLTAKDWLCQDWLAMSTRGEAMRRCSTCVIYLPSHN